MKDAYEYSFSYLDSQCERQREVWSLLAPLNAFSPGPYKDTNFPLRPSEGWLGGKLEHPWAFLNQTDRKWSSTNPRPHGDSHEFPQFHWPVVGLLIQRCTAVLLSHKGTSGGQEARRTSSWKKFLFHHHNMTQITVDWPLCLKLKEKQKVHKNRALLRSVCNMRDQSLSSLKNTRKCIFSFPLFSFMFGHKQRVLCTHQWLRHTEHACQWEWTTGERYIFTNIYALTEGERGKG